MRTRGKITHWNRDKGYGFITPATGAKQVFVNIRAFSRRDHQPAVNQQVSFVLSTDKQGRPCAARVLLASDAMPGLTVNKSTALMAGALVFLLLVAAAAVVGPLPLEVLWLYLAASMLTYLIYYFDKSAAQAGKWRTQESTLHSLALLGGWPGAMGAQQVFRHKTSKASFRAVFWATVVINCALLAWLFTDAGRAALQQML